MKTIAAAGLALALLAPSIATAAISRGEQMKACAAEWQAKGHHKHGMRYQHFMRECLKKMAASQ